jgi:hypothetical protein
MAFYMVIDPVKTYKTAANAMMAVEKCQAARESKCRFFITEYMGPIEKHQGRFFPVFVGMEAVADGLHHHFNVIG